MDIPPVSLRRLLQITLTILCLSTQAIAGLGYGASSYGSGWYGYGPATIITSTVQVVLPEGTTTQVSIHLSTQPPASQTVNVSRFSGDEDITISGTASFVFSTGNWNQNQTFTLAAALDEDSVNSQAVVRCASTEMASTNLTVTESDRIGADDTDGDGHTNFDEYLAGTDWLSGQSRFEPSITRSGNSLTINFEAVATTPEYGGKVRHYKLETIDDLTGGIWSTVSGAADITTYGSYDYITPISETKRFYRVQTWLTP